MSIKTTFLSQKEVKTELSALISNLDSIVKKTDLILSENLYQADKKSYQFIGDLLKNNNLNSRLEKAFSNHLFSALYRAETTSAGSAYIGFKIATYLTRELLKGNLNETEQIMQKNAEKTIEKCIGFISKNTKICSKEDIISTIKDCTENVLLREVIWEAVNLAGLEGKIYIENGRQTSYTVESKEGYVFNLNPFKWMIEKGPWERKEVKVLIVDGMIEKVSELDHILTKAFETKQPVVIFAMGFSEEVGMTLKANLDRGLLDVQPVRIPSDLDSLNVVNDIATVCGTTPISSLKGDLIVFKKWEDMPSIEKIRVTHNQTTIENSNTRAAVSNQIKSLLEKRHENNLYEDVQNLIDKRIKSLVSSAVVIHLPDLTTSQNDSQRIQIDLALRQIKTILNYGTVNLADIVFNLETEIENDTDKIICNILKEILQDEKFCNIPTLSLVAAIKIVIKSIMMFVFSAGFVSIDS